MTMTTSTVDWLIHIRSNGDKKKTVHPYKMLNKMNIAKNYVYNAFFRSRGVLFLIEIQKLSYKNSTALGTNCKQHWIQYQSKA
jgi:hypothetical protein